VIADVCVDVEINHGQGAGKIVPKCCVYLLGKMAELRLEVESDGLR
jgi:hypothetical protein